MIWHCSTASSGSLQASKPRTGGLPEHKMRCPATVRCFAGNIMLVPEFVGNLTCRVVPSTSDNTPLQLWSSSSAMPDSCLEGAPGSPGLGAASITARGVAAWLEGQLSPSACSSTLQ